MLATIWAVILTIVKAIVPSLSTTWFMSGIKAVITDIGKLPKWVQALIVLGLSFLAVKVFIAVGFFALGVLGSLVAELIVTFLGAIGIYKLEQDFLTSSATTTTATK